MRTTWISVLLLCGILFGSVMQGRFLRKTTDTLSAHLEQIPATAAEMEQTDVQQLHRMAQTLRETWDRVFPYMTYTVGYTALNRADDAVIQLCGYLETGSFADAVVAYRTLSDALRRIRENETVSVSSIF